MHRNATPLPVMPANAGIQSHEHYRSTLDPAFAGMTDNKRRALTMTGSMGARR
jgi:hypothetical protein